MDFYQLTGGLICNLNETDRRLFDFVVHNLKDVSSMSIRSFAERCFVSTTTIMRFVKKIGFDNYKAFSASLVYTINKEKETNIPNAIVRDNYSNEYIKNIMETVRVISNDSIMQLKSKIEPNSRLFFYGEGINKEVTEYAYRMFTSIGYNTYLPKLDYEIDSMINKASHADIIFIFSLSGEDKEGIRIIEQSSKEGKPFIVSITWAGNNTIQNLCDLDFYVFTEQIMYNGMDLSSTISMISIVEIIIYMLIQTNMK